MPHTLPHAETDIAEAERLMLSERDSLRVLDLLEKPAGGPRPLGARREGRPHSAVTVQPASKTAFRIACGNAIARKNPFGYRQSSPDSSITRSRPCLSAAGSRSAI